MRNKFSECNEKLLIQFWMLQKMWFFSCNRFDAEHSLLQIIMYNETIAKIVYHEQTFESTE